MRMPVRVPARETPWVHVPPSRKLPLEHLGDMSATEGGAWEKKVPLKGGHANDHRHTQPGSRGGKEPRPREDRSESAAFSPPVNHGSVVIQPSLIHLLQNSFQTKCLNGELERRRCERAVLLL